MPFSSQLARALGYLLLTVSLAGCGGGGGGSATPPEEVVYFGPLTDEAVAFRIAGTVRYEDRLYGIRSTGGYGFTGITVFKPVRHAMVDVVADDGTLLLTTSTDELGRFDASTTAAGLLHLRIVARTNANAGPRITVNTNDVSLYAVTRYFVPAAGSWTLDTDIPADSVGGAWNILDVCTAAAEFMHERSGEWPPVPLTAYWSRNSTEGTWFDNDGIHVLGGSGPVSGDTDEYDDDVLLHEFGHFVERFTGNADSMGGYHILNDNTQDMRLAWSEGFASWFSGAVKQWLDERHSAVLSDTSGTLSDARLGPLYLDTYNSGERLHWFFDIDYATVPSRDLSSSFSTAETSIAKVLWNITRQYGFARLWSAYRAWPGAAQRLRPVSIETYRDNWDGLYPGELPLAAYLERRIDYSADGFEADGVPGQARSIVVDAEPQPADRHTLDESGNDVDYFKVELSANTRYAVETFGLLNGADTRLTIHSISDPHHAISRCGGSAAGVCDNDNASLASYDAPAPDTDINHRLMLNDGCKLASRLIFTPATSGIWLVRVTAAPSPSPGAGRFGSYYLKISRNPPAYRCP